MQKLVILDPQAHYIPFLRDYFGKSCEIFVCEDYAGAAEYIADIKPDYLILDFTSSLFEGFTLLRSAISFGANPSVIGIVQSSFYFTAMVEKEKNIASTLFRPINQEVIANRISLMMELPPEKRIPLPTRRQYLACMLASLDIYTDRLGGRNLLDVIPMAADNRELSYSKHLYLGAGKITGHSVQNVERNIRTAIENGLGDGRKKNWAKYFPVNEEGIVPKPCNSDFISLLARILKAQRDQYRDDE